VKTIVITGAAGLVAQNLIPRLKPLGHRLIGIDKHPRNTEVLRKLHPDIDVINADLAVPGDWSDALEGADVLVLNQAQIGGLNRAEFVANNVTATQNLIEAVRRHDVPYVIHVSSSVINSHAHDFYTETKTEQERLVAAMDVAHVILRPTLMFGWFDRKHLGWLRRFMERTPIFPIPGNGRFLRQPLYAGDFAAIIASCVEKPIRGIYDISGLEQIDFGDLIQLIHDIVKPRARIVNIPYGLFWVLLIVYARFDRNPPFTTHQLEALVIPESFPVIDWPEIFDVPVTPLKHALEETYCDPRYAEIALEF
jgi:nucleoside-diphosphate-sugar epimerase